MWLQIGHLAARVTVRPQRESSRRAFRASMERPANVHDDIQHRNALIITNNYSWSVAMKQKKQ